MGLKLWRIRRRLRGSWIPQQPLKSGKNVSIVTHNGTLLLDQIEHSFREYQIVYNRSVWENFVILSGLDSALVHCKLGIPPEFGRLDWKDPPLSPDGFN